MNTLRTATALIRLALISLTLFGLAACASRPGKPAADLVLLNGKVYTAEQPRWAQAIAVTGKRISYVGSDKGAMAFIGRKTRQIDLRGQMLMPGIVDAHLHPLDGSLKILYRCNFPFSAGPQAIQAAVKRCVQNSDSDWIIGGQWDSSFFVNHKLESPRRFLDAVSADKAVVLIADSGHDAWLNSKALAIVGINRNSPDPDGGTIVRADDGTPNGVLLENAQKPVYKFVPKPSKAQYLEAARTLMEVANGYGVTAMKDASAEESDIQALFDLAAENALSAHMASAINLQPDDWQGEQFSTDRLVRISEQYQRENLDTRYVKIFLDGVPTASRTAAMLDNYLPQSSEHAAHSGDTHYSGEQLVLMLKALDAQGFTVKIHTAGDRSVRMALDAIAQVRQTNGHSGLRHELAHAGFIAAQDIPRFRELQAVADLSPFIWHPSPIMDSVIQALGDRGRQYWPVKDLYEDDAPILAGSDWPSAVASMNPWIGIEALITRADPEGISAGTLWAEQAISLDQALQIFTRHGALALRLAQDTGSLRAGKLADFIVLDRDLFDIPAADISETRVLATYFQGRLVHSQDAQRFSAQPVSAE